MRRSSIGLVLMAVGLLWLWWGYMASTVVEAGWMNGSVWLRMAGGIALVLSGLYVWFIWRTPHP